MIEGKCAFFFVSLLTVCVWPMQDNMVKSNIDKKFSAHYDAVEAELKSSTVGKLVCIPKAKPSPRMSTQHTYC